MDVVVAGGHGQVGLRLLKLLAARGDRARGLIRNPDQAADLERIGAEAVVCDLEDSDADIGAAVEGANAVVFAAGAGPGSGPERKRTVDCGGAVRLIEAAQDLGIERYVMVSAHGVNHPDGWSDEMRPYYQAKLDADIALEASDLAFAIVRPGTLTDEPGTGRVEAAERIEHRGQVSREDVAATIVAVLDTFSNGRISFDLLSGDTPVTEAVEALAALQPSA